MIFMSASAYPTSERDELAIIGCCLSGGLETSIEAVESVNVESFSRPDVRDAFGVIEALATEGKEVNPYTLNLKSKELGNGSVSMELLSTVDAVHSVANLPAHIDAVTEAWRKRGLMEACHAIFTKGTNPGAKADALIADLEKAMSGHEVRGIDTLDGKKCCDRLIDDLERRANLQGNLSGVPTGLYWFDRFTDGLQYGEQTVIGARPSQGKTAIALGIAVNACFKNKVPTLFVSLEMSVEALMRRLCSSWAEIGMSELKRGSYTEAHFKSFTVFRDFASRAPLWITDGVDGMRVNQLCAIVRRRVRKNGVRLVVIDYLQKIRPEERHEKRTYEIGAVSGALKSLAVSTKAALLTLAQINRENERDKGRIPRLADLADSSQIERDADTVGLIHRRRDDTEGKAQLIIAKQRDGETGHVDLIFNGKFARFENPT